MKKNYIQPEMSVYQINLCEIVCTSAGIRVMDNKYADEQEGLVREYEKESIWSQEW